MRLLVRLAETSYGRPFVALLLALILTGGLSVPLFGLTLDAELTALLPEDSTAWADMQELERRYGGLGFLIVVAWGAESDEALEEFATEYARKLEALPQVKFVTYDKPVEFFKDRGLYYLDEPDLQTIHDRLKARIKFEKNQRNPLYFDLEDEEPPSLDFSDLQDKYKERGGGGGDGAADERFYIDRQAGRCLLLVKPDGEGANLDFAHKLLADVEGVLGDAPVQWTLTGRYKRWPMQQEVVAEDLGLSTIVAVLLMLGYLAIHFRRFWGVVLVGVPLLLGVVWTLGVAGLIFEDLNVMTGMVGAILLGLGIDHGIHLLGRYEACRSITLTFGDTGRAVVTAAATTLAAFAAVATSDFVGFHELGVVAGIGMICCVLAYGWVMPAMLGVLEQRGWRPREHQGGQSPWARMVSRRAPIVVAVALAVVALAGLRLPDAKFDDRFSTMEPGQLAPWYWDRVASGILGYSRMPVIVLTQDLEGELRSVEVLKQRVADAGDSSAVRKISSMSDAVPLDQEAKQTVIKRIRRQVKKVKDGWVQEENRAHFTDLKRMVKAKPFARADLPVALMRTFDSGDGIEGKGQVLVFPADDVTGGSRAIELMQQTSNIDIGDGKTLSATGDTVLMAAVFQVLLSEIAPIVGLTALAVIAVLWLLLGRLRDVMLVLIPATFTVLVMAGVMPWADLHINYLNVAFIPVLFGLAVDGGVHLVVRLQEGASVAEVLDDTGRAVCGALLTSALGFGSLLLAEHPGLYSVGAMMVLGLMTNLLATIVVLPAVASLLGGPRDGVDPIVGNGA
jgi:predicted RND superfamily exporter protein